MMLSARAVVPKEVRSARKDRTSKRQASQQIPIPRWNMLEIALPPAPLPALYDALEIYPKLFWRSAKTQRQFVAAGRMLEFRQPLTLEARQVLRALLRRHPALMLVGGMGFDQQCCRDFPWNDFGAQRWFIPQFLVFQAPNGLRLRFVFSEQDRSAYQSLLQFFTQWQHIRGNHPPAIPTATVVCHQPNASGWRQRVLTVRQAIAQGRVHKVVLSRQTMVEFAQTPQPAGLLQYLRMQFPAAVVFCFQPAPTAAFCGATPEHLFVRTDRHLWTRAIAGTRRRHRDPVSDQRLRSELLSSRKDQQEHAYVVSALRQALHHLSERLTTGETTLLSLPHLYHLQTPVTAVLKPEIDDFDLIDALHPTPAVGGTPRQAALALIRQLEPYSRGWYAAPIGWITAGQSEIAVAIRSFLLMGRIGVFYTGAGLVLTSDPDLEWQELEHKLATFAAWMDHALE